MNRKIDHRQSSRYYPSAVNFPGDFIMSQTDIVSLQKEGKKFKPSAAFVKHAHIKSAATYKKLHTESIKQPQKFWTRVSKELHWFKRGRNCTSGMSHSQSGSSAARPMSPIIVSTGI